MARKRSSRRRGKNKKGFVVIPREQTVTLGALAAGAMVKNTDVTFGEDIFVISVDALWSMQDHTTGEGPITVGFAHSDLSVTEIDEYLEANLSDPDDIIAMERGRRPVRRVGSFGGILASESLNDGKPIRTTFKMSIGDGHGIAVWAKNRDGSPLTAGTLIKCDYTIYGRWQR